MKKHLSLLLLAALPFQADAVILLQPSNPPTAVALAWDASVDASVIGYKVYYGITPGQYTNAVTVANVTTATVTNLVRGTTYYFAATAFNGEGLESEFSNEVSVRITPVPLPPSRLQATNSIMKVSLESSNRPDGPWTPFMALWASTEMPAFYRSKIEFQKPDTLPIIRKQLNTTPPPLPGGKS